MEYVKNGDAFGNLRLKTSTLTKSGAIYLFEDNERIIRVLNDRRTHDFIFAGFGNTKQIFVENTKSNYATVQLESEDEFYQAIRSLSNSNSFYGSYKLSRNKGEFIYTPVGILSPSQAVDRLKQALG